MNYLTSVQILNQRFTGGNVVQPTSSYSYNSEPEVHMELCFLLRLGVYWVGGVGELLVGDGVDAEDRGLGRPQHTTIYTVHIQPIFHAFSTSHIFQEPRGPNFFNKLIFSYKNIKKKKTPRKKHEIEFPEIAFIHKNFFPLSLQN